MAIAVTPTTHSSPLLDFCDKHNLEVLTIDQSGTWPTSPSSIVEFESGVVGYVNDVDEMTVTDPRDGSVRKAGVYGRLVGYANYHKTDTPDIDTTVTQLDDPLIYTALKHETTYSVSRKLRHLNFTEADFVEHNDLKAGAALTPGQQYRLPIERPEAALSTWYDIYAPAADFYIKTIGGAHKWAFGKSDSLKDIVSWGSNYPENKQIKVAALAYVPVDGETYVYCMDELAFGDYKTTGKVRHPVGFSWSDVAEGIAPVTHVEDLQPVPVAPAIQEQIQETLAAVTLPESVELPIERPVPSQPESGPVNPNMWKSSGERYRDDFGVPSPVLFQIDLPKDQLVATIRDLDMKAPPLTHKHGDEVLIAGLFYKDNQQYGRPQSDLEHPLRPWHGYPVDLLQPVGTPEEIREEYGLDEYEDDDERTRALLPWERFIVTPSARTYAKVSKVTVAVTTKVKTKIKKRKLIQ